jgi:type II secretory pathway pseudopilin PulG
LFLLVAAVVALLAVVILPLLCGATGRGRTTFES